MQPLVYVPRCEKKKKKMFLLFCFRPNTRNLCDTVYKRMSKPFLVKIFYWMVQMLCCFNTKYNTHICLEVIQCSFCIGEFFYQ